jgi:hypothetical protein
MLSPDQVTSLEKSNEDQWWKEVFDANDEPMNPNSQKKSQQVAAE